MKFGMIGAGTLAQASASHALKPATTWSRVREALASLPGRILIDATNQWAVPPPAFILDQLDVSGSELVALRPESRVTKAFDNLYGPVIATDPVTPAGRGSTFYAGDGDDAKRSFRAVVENFGLAPVALGPLVVGRLMQVDGPLTDVHAIRKDVPHPGAGLTVQAPRCSGRPLVSARTGRRDG